MVTDEALAKAMIDQPGIADGAGEAMAAGTAQRQRRIAAAIEEEQRLLAPLDRGPDLAGEPRRDEAAARGRLAAQIDGLDMRHVLAAEARGQRDALIAVLARIDLGFHRRRRGGQHDRNFCDMSAHHRHVTGVVVHAVVLLVGLVVLLIDDDEAKIGVREKQRRTRADHDRRRTFGDRGPIARAGARGELGMPFDRPHAKTLREAIEELAGQRDLRHQDQRLLAAADHLGDRFEIDLGLARAGDAVEQRDMEGAVGRERAHRIHTGTLQRRKIRPAEFRIGCRRRRRRRHWLNRERAFIDEAVDHARGDAGLLGRLGLAVQQPVRQQRDNALARRCQALRRIAGQAHAGAHPLRAEIFAHAQAHAQHHAARAQRVVCDPVHHRAQLRLERRNVELLADLLEAVMQARIGIGVLAPDHGQHLARTERHTDEIASLQLHAARHLVGIGLVERDRHQHIDHAGGGGGVVARRLVHERGIGTLRPSG
ncbi:hypothetical protein ABH999_002555 [Bradyrhizobium yuanmingense]